jgi:hypothetical protein
MSQAENRNTTNPTRRAVLAGAPAVAALAAGAATGGIANALASPSNADPVFAAIAEYKAAVQARSIVLDNVDNEEAYPSERAWDQAQGLASDREQDAINAILESEPTTIAGIAAVLKILATDPYEDEAAAIDDVCPGGSTSLFAMKMRTLFRHIDPRPTGMRKATLARRIGKSQHHPPLRRGMNSVSSVAGSNFETILLWPGPVRSAAVKPAPVSSLNRASAFATPAASFGSNWCRVSPV